MKTITLHQLSALRPCARDKERVYKLLRKFGKGPYSATDAVAAGCTLDDLVWVASALQDKDVHRRLRLWQADCAARVLHIYERDYSNDDRPRKAIIAARKHTRGQISDAAIAAARGAARAAEERWQLERLVKWLGEKEPRCWPLPPRNMT